MKKTVFSSLILSLACSQVSAFNFPEQKIRAYHCEEACEKLEKERIQDSWKISDHDLEHRHQPILKSYSYKKTVRFQDLQQGVEIPTFGPGAVIRIYSSKQQPLPSLHLLTPKGKELSLLEAASQHSVDPNGTLRSLGSEHQRLLQINPDIGQGMFLLKSKAPAKKEQNEDRYVISVYDKYSNLYVTVETDKDNYQYGDKLVATITANSGFFSDIEEASATIIYPDGEKSELNLEKRHSHQFIAETTVKYDKNPRGANWYIEASVSGLNDNSLYTRVGHSAFNYAIPSAKLLELKKLGSEHYQLRMESAIAARFALNAVLFYKDAQGNPHPFRMIQISDWMNGEDKINFEITAEQLDGHAPDKVAIGYFHLIDYAQLRTVYHYDSLIELNTL